MEIFIAERCPTLRYMGGTLTAPLYLPNSPHLNLNLPHEIVNKIYVDTTLNNIYNNSLGYINNLHQQNINNLHNLANNAITELPIGSIIMSSYDINTSTNNPDPNKWLECNGSYISKNTYSNLFSVVSHVYEDHYGSVTLPFTPNFSLAIPHPSRNLYLPDSVSLSIGQSVTNHMAPDHSSINNATVNLQGSKMLVINQKVYIVMSGPLYGNSIIDTILIADIDQNGNITNIAKSPSSLYSNLNFSAWTCANIAVIRKKLYLLGGRYSPSSNPNTIIYNEGIYVSNIDNSGNLGPFNQISLNLPNKYISLHCLITKTRFYILGGTIFINNSATQTSNVYYCNIDSDGNLLGPFTNSNPLPLSGMLKLAVIGNRVVILSGNNLTHFYKANIDQNGNIGAFLQGENISSVIPSNLVPAFTQPNSVFDPITINNKTVILIYSDGNDSTIKFLKIDFDPLTGNFLGITNLTQINSISIGNIYADTFDSMPCVTRNRILFQTIRVSDNKNFISSIDFRAAYNDYRYFLSGQSDYLSSSSLATTFYPTVNNPDPFNLFKLPDFTHKNPYMIKHYIKYS